jgi:hypothetical protein
MSNLAKKIKNILEVLYILPRRKIVITIGDEGAIVFLIDKDTIQDRYFTKSADPVEDKICSIFTKNKKAPICLFLDTIDQQFKVQDVLAVNFLSLQQLLKHRLDKVLSDYELKKAIYLHKLDKSKLEYVFAGVKITENIQHWLNYIKSLPNSIAFISALPAEYCLLANKLESSKAKQKSQDRWKIIVTENKVSGFRQVVFRNNKIVLARLVEETEEELTDILAGNIHQELINVTSYLGRLKYEPDKHRLEVYVIVSKEIKHSMSAMKFKIENIKILTPYEISEILQVAHIAKPENRFADVILSYFAAKSGPVAKFLLPGMVKVLILNHMNKVFNFCFILLFVLLLGYLVDGSVSLFMGKRDYKKLEKNLAQAQNELAQLKDSTQDRGYDYTKVVDIQGIYSKVLEHSQKNQQLIAELKKLKEFSQIVSIQSFSWTFQGNVVDLEINANIVNNSGRYSELFAKYRKFKNNLYDAFSGYTIEMSGLPSDVGLHTDLTKLLVNIRISK